MFRLNKRSWIPIIGWILCYGFFNNCVIAPYFHVDLVDWEQLLTSLGIMLGISGIRDIGIKMNYVLNKLPLANASGINHFELRSPSPNATQA